MSATLVSHVVKCLPLEPFEANLPAIGVVLAAVEALSIAFGVGAVVLVARRRTTGVCAVVSGLLALHVGCCLLVMFLVFAGAIYRQVEDGGAEVARCKAAIANQLVDSVFVVLVLVVLVSAACVVRRLRLSLPSPGTRGTDGRD